MVRNSNGGHGDAIFTFIFSCDIIIRARPASSTSYSVDDMSGRMLLACAMQAHMRTQSKALRAWTGAWCCSDSPSIIAGNAALAANASESCSTLLRHEPTEPQMAHVTCM